MISYRKIYILILGLLLVTTLRPNNDPILLRVSGEPNTAVNPGYISQFGSNGTGDAQFFYPYGIEINSPIQIFDLAGNFVGKFGNSGTGDGQFDRPYGIAVNSSHIFVLDSSNNRVQIFDLAGNFVSKFGSFGTGDGQFGYPFGIAVNRTHIFVADSNNNRVQIFDLAGNFVSKSSFINNPTGIAVNSTHIFVTEGNFRVQIFDSAGNFVTQFGNMGTGDGEFGAPWGLKVNDTHIFVADALNNRVQVFDLAGVFVTKFGNSGTGDGQFRQPVDIAVNNTHIFVADNANDRIQIFQRNFAPQQLADETVFSDIALTWNPPLDNNTNLVTAYRIYRGQQINQYNLLAETSDLFYVDLGVLSDQTYYYWVTAVTLTGESMLSDVITVHTFTPQQLTAHVGLTSIGLTWNPPLDGDTNPVTGYRIYRGQELGKYSFLAETSFLSFVDLNTVVNQTYYYVVTAVTETGESIASIAVSGKVTLPSTITETVT
ncbi:MAG: 6-bladed beta-propeller, partial [Candidatus Kariarchaeaceae archaeon]